MRLLEMAGDINAVTVAEKNPSNDQAFLKEFSSRPVSQVMNLLGMAGDIDAEAIKESFF